MKEKVNFCISALLKILKINLFYSKTIADGLFLEVQEHKNQLENFHMVITLVYQRQLQKNSSPIVS